MVALCASALIVVMALIGCARGPRAILRNEPPMTYEAVATAHNARAARLDRIWARAIVELWYVDDRGARRREQGEGHLQIRQPGDVALSIGKLGETYAWLGADGERFWFFDRFDEPRAVVGRLDNVGRPCAERLGLPADPLTLVDLIGASPIPDAGGATAWSEDGRSVVVSFDRHGGRERLWLDAASLLPRRIELAGAEPDGRLVSVLENDTPVHQRDEGGFYPLLASRIEIVHAASETRIALHLSDAEDGRSRPGRLSDRAFDFDTLRAVFRPVEIHVLDANCAQAALGG